jgi:catalase
MDIWTHTSNLPQRLLSAMLVLSAPIVSAQSDDVTAEQVVTALEGTYGVHPGQRRNHTKGTCALGEFVGTAEAPAYSRSPMFSGSSVPVVARFSLAGGNPKASDTEG